MERLEITPFDKTGRLRDDQRFAVLFNPASYSVAKSVAWSAASDQSLNAPTLSFGGGQSRVLTLELFYDVTEPARLEGAARFADDVRTETGRMVALTRIDPDLQCPPTVEVSWGGAGPRKSDFPFHGVVSSLTQNFTLFSPEGKPLRATLSVAFTEFLVKELDLKDTDPELTTRVARSGDRLDTLAAEHYRDPAAWRLIAEANGIDDPRRIPAGRRLTLPGD